MRLFPFGSIFDWLSYGDSATFRRRELSYTLATPSVYVRHKSWGDVDSFKADIVRLTPSKIDIGAVYPRSPAELGKPVSKELVFDIDLTDYDDIRFCCTTICPRCWTLIAAAIKIVDHCLRARFAFKHIMWVFSGRRGVHCWVSDEIVRNLGSNGRAAVIDYLSFQRETKMHPDTQLIYETAIPYFCKFVDDQEILKSEEKWKPLLEMLPSPEMRRMLHENWTTMATATTQQRWEQLVALVGPHNRALKEIVLSYVHPRFDAAVTRDFAHLLKSPFAVHPATGRICVPIATELADCFDPSMAPTVDDPDLPATLMPYLAVFDQYVASLDRRNRNR